MFDEGTIAMRAASGFLLVDLVDHSDIFCDGSVKRWYPANDPANDGANLSRSVIIDPIIGDRSHLDIENEDQLVIVVFLVVAPTKANFCPCLRD